MRLSVLAGVMTLACFAHSAMAKNVDGDPEAVAEALSELGYKPRPIEMAHNSPVITVDVKDTTTAFAFGDCENGKDCNYVVLLTSFEDVIDPPQSWVNEVNSEMDMGKISIRPDKTVIITLPVALGEDGVPVDTIRYALDQWDHVVTRVAQSAYAAKLLQN